VVLRVGLAGKYKLDILGLARKRVVYTVDSGDIMIIHI